VSPRSEPTAPVVRSARRCSRGGRSVRANTGAAIRRPRTVLDENLSQSFPLMMFQLGMHTKNLFLRNETEFSYFSVCVTCTSSIFWAALRRRFLSARASLKVASHVEEPATSYSTAVRLSARFNLAASNWRRGLSDQKRRQSACRSANQSDGEVACLSQTGGSRRWLKPTGQSQASALSLNFGVR
jgi:hypothetical protein